MTDKIQRQVHFITAPIFDPQDITGINNNWQYNRAPPGFLFQLHSMEVNTTRTGSVDWAQGILALFDGHEYTHWNIWPGVQSNELLTRVETTQQNLFNTASLNLWECKEYTIGARSSSETKLYKANAIVWYYLKKASRMELMEYAIKHPRNQDMFRHAIRGTTVEPTE